MNCLHSFKWKIKLQSHEKDYRNHDFLMLPFMPDEKYKILKYTKYTKFLESMPFIIYADLESLKIILKIHVKQKQVNIFHRVFSMPTILSFKSIEDNHDVYRGRGCMKMFSKTFPTHNGDK